MLLLFGTAVSMSMMCQLGSTRITKLKESHSQSCNLWGSIQHCGKLITGLQEVDLKRLIGAKHLSMLITRTLILKGALCQDPLTVPQTPAIGGKEQLTNCSVHFKLECISGFVWTTWSMTTVLINRGSQWPHQSVLRVSNFQPIKSFIYLVVHIPYTPTPYVRTCPCICQKEPLAMHIGDTRNKYELSCVCVYVD